MDVNATRINRNWCLAIFGRRRSVPETTQTPFPPPATTLRRIPSNVNFVEHVFLVSSRQFVRATKRSFVFRVRNVRRRSRRKFFENPRERRKRASRAIRVRRTRSIPYSGLSGAIRSRRGETVIFRRINYSPPPTTGPNDRRTITRP